MTVTERLPHFDNPPLDRVVLGAAYDPLPRLRAVHLGLFWSTLGQDAFPSVQEMNGHPVSPEEFPARREAPDFDLSFVDRPALPRVVWTHKDGNLEIALQADRLQVAWQRGEEPYPRFEYARDFFVHYFQMWREFVHAQGLGEIRTRQAEVSYFNTLARGMGWTDIGGLAGVVHVAQPAATRGGDLEEYHYSDSYALSQDPHRGRLRLTLFSGRSAADAHDAAMTLTVKGPTNDEDLLDYLNFGHEAIVSAFLDATSQAAQEMWGRRRPV